MTRSIIVNGLTITFPDDMSLVYDSQGITLARTAQTTASTPPWVQPSVQHEQTVEPVKPVRQYVRKYSKRRPPMAGSLVLPATTEDDIIRIMRNRQGKTFVVTISTDLRSLWAQDKLQYWQSRRIRELIKDMTDRGVLISLNDEIGTSRLIGLASMIDRTTVAA